MTGDVLAQLLRALGPGGFLLVLYVPALFPALVSAFLLARLDTTMRRWTDVNMLLIRGMDRAGLLDRVRDEDLDRVMQGRRGRD